MRRGHILLALFVLAAGACAKRVPEPKVHPSTPHVSWSIAQGDHEKEVCRSTELSSCTLALSTEPADRRVADFHLFLHAAVNDTKYTGTVVIGFMAQEGAAGHHHTINQIVPRGSDPIGSSTTGIVGPAGTYYVDIALTATAADGSGMAVPLKQRIKVDVK